MRARSQCATSKVNGIRPQGSTFSKGVSSQYCQICLQYWELTPLRRRVSHPNGGCHPAPQSVMFGGSESEPNRYEAEFPFGCSFLCIAFRVFSEVDHHERRSNLHGDNKYDRDDDQPLRTSNHDHEQSAAR